MGLRRSSPSLMRNAVLIGVFGGLATFVACAAPTGSRAGSGGPDDTTTTGTGGSMGAGQNGGIIGSVDGGLTGNNPNNMTVADPVPDPCMTTADCPGGGMGYVCTVANKCGKISGDCANQAECSGDSYCCKGAECRKDALDQGVCIPGYVPPGVACKGEAHVGVFSPAKQCEWPAAATPKDFPQHVQVFSTPMVADTPVDSGTSAEIIFVAGNQSSGEVFGSNPAYFGVIRIVSGQTCELKATIN